MKNIALIVSSFLLLSSCSKERPQYQVSAQQLSPPQKKSPKAIKAAKLDRDGDGIEDEREEPGHEVLYDRQRPEFALTAHAKIHFSNGQEFEIPLENPSLNAASAYLRRRSLFFMSRSKEKTVEDLSQGFFAFNWSPLNIQKLQYFLSQKENLKQNYKFILNIQLAEGASTEEVKVLLWNPRKDEFLNEELYKVGLLKRDTQEFELQIQFKEYSLEALLAHYLPVLKYQGKAQVPDNFAKIIISTPEKSEIYYALEGTKKEHLFSLPEWQQETLEEIVQYPQDNNVFQAGKSYFFLSQWQKLEAHEVLKKRRERISSQSGQQMKIEAPLEGEVFKIRAWGSYYHEASMEHTEHGAKEALSDCQNWRFRLQ